MSRLVEVALAPRTDGVARTSSSFSAPRSPKYSLAAFRPGHVVGSARATHRHRTCRDSSSDHANAEGTAQYNSGRLVDYGLIVNLRLSHGQ